MKIYFAILTSVTHISLQAHAGNCLQKAMTFLQEEKFKEADKFVRSEDCEPELKEKNGDLKELSSKEFSNNIMMLYSSHIGCEKAYEKYKKKAPSLRSPHALEQVLMKGCGPKAYSYRITEQLERTTGVNLWNSSRWSRLISSEKAADKKKQEMAENEVKRKENERVMHMKSAQFSLEEACHKHHRLQLIKSAINDENESAKFSGVKDKKRLLSLGRQANAFTKLLKKHKGDYKNQSGREWAPHQCN